MPKRHDKFVHDENLRRYAEQIEAETDPARLAMLHALLKAEQERDLLTVSKLGAVDP